jgi:phosphate transport system protein
MLRALMNLFRSDDPLGVMGNDFSRMLQLSHDMCVSAGRIFFGGESEAENRTVLYKIDIQVNSLERSVRKLLVAHLAMPGNERDVPYGLAMMSLVKDVERLGDYAKNLAEVVELHEGAFPDDEITRELEEIRAGVEETFSASLGVVAELNHDKAQQLILQGRALTKRCDSLLRRIARSGHDSSTTTALVLGARYYKRIVAHVVNILTSIVMPLHKLDYYDEDALTIKLERET